MVSLNENHPDPAASNTLDVHERLTNGMLRAAVQVAQEAGASALFVFAEALHNRDTGPLDAFEGRVFYMTRAGTETNREMARGHTAIEVPHANLSRMDQIKMAVLLALSRNLLNHGDLIACVSGAPQSQTLDTIIVLDIDREFNLFFLDEINVQLPADVNPGVLDRVLDIAISLANEGREGRVYGSLFVVGDIDRVRTHSRQLIMNPFKGYAPEERNLLDSALDETIKELCAIDGAFIIRGDGVIEAAGAYLKIPASADFELPPGLGARHQAAAGITAVTHAFAVTVSQSTGTVAVFRSGVMIMEIERSRGTIVSRRP